MASPFFGDSFGFEPQYRWRLHLFSAGAVHYFMISGVLRDLGGGDAPLLIGIEFCVIVLWTFALFAQNWRVRRNRPNSLRRILKIPIGMPNDILEASPLRCPPHLDRQGKGGLTAVRWGRMIEPFFI